MNDWSSLALAVAAILAALWLYLARLMINLRTQYVRLHPATGEPVPVKGEDVDPQVMGQPTLVRIGDEIKPVYYMGALVRRWDQLPPARQRRLSMGHKLAGIGAIVFGALGILGLLM